MKMIAMENEAGCDCPNSGAGAVQDCGSAAMQRIERSVAYMSQHLDQPLQVATLAAHANISPSHFFALFKRRIGSAPMDYFTRLRMQRACRPGLASPQTFATFLEGAPLYLSLKISS